MVTIIFPSRGRLELVKQLLNSIETNTYDKSQIDVISICDQDDIDTINLFYEISPTLSYDFKFISRRKHDILDLPNDYYDLGLKLAQDSYFLWILGNDCEIVTENWDYMLRQSLTYSIPTIYSDIENNSKFYYIKINDDTHIGDNGEFLNKYDDKSCCFPLLSMNYYYSSGEFYPKEIPTWGGDSCLYILTTKSNKFSIIDACDILKINHYTYINQRIEQDDISKRIEREHLDRKEEVDGSKYDWWSLPENFTKILMKRKHILWDE